MWIGFCCDLELGFYWVSFGWSCYFGFLFFLSFLSFFYLVFFYFFSIGCASVNSYFFEDWSLSILIPFFSESISFVSLFFSFSSYFSPFFLSSLSPLLISIKLYFSNCLSSFRVMDFSIYSASLSLSLLLFSAYFFWWERAYLGSITGLYWC